MTDLQHCQKCGAQYKRSPHWRKVKEMARGTETSCLMPTSAPLPEDHCPICGEHESYQKADDYRATM